MEPVIQYTLAAVVLLVVAVGSFAFARYLQRAEEGAPARLIKVANAIITEFEREQLAQTQAIAAMQAKSVANQTAYAEFLKRLSTLPATGSLPASS